MSDLHPDIIAKITLFRTDAGGRQGPTPDKKFNCLVKIDDAYFDVRLNLEKTGAISPGQTVRVPVNFLDRESARGHCSIGKRFFLKEFNIIGDGTIEDVVFDIFPKK